MARSIARWVLALAAAAMVGSAVGAAPTRVALDWTPNTNHTGLFVALDRGYFADEGLSVEWLEPTPTLSLQLAASGRAEFAVSMQEYVTMARAQGVPVVSIAALYPHNTSGFAAPADRGVASPKDFEGLRYGGWGSELEEVMVRTVMDRAGAASDRIEMVNIGTIDFTTAVRRGLADLFWIYYGWQGIHAQLEGIDFTYLPLVDLAPELDYYTPVLVASETMMAEHPEVVERFLRATARGYVFAALHPAEAAGILLDYAPTLDSALVTASQVWLADQSVTDLTQWGYQRASVWEAFAAWAFDNGLIDRAIDAAAAFTNRFLPGGDAR